MPPGRGLDAENRLCFSQNKQHVLTAGAVVCFPWRGDGVRLTEPRDHDGPIVSPCCGGRWQRLITRSRAEGGGESRGKRPWGDKGSSVVAGPEKLLMEEGRHSRPPTTTEVQEGRLDPCAGGLSEPPGPRVSWGRQMAAIILVTGRDHPQVARTLLGLRPFPGLWGQEEQAEKERLVLPKYFFFAWHFLGRCWPSVVQLGMHPWIFFALHNHPLSLSSPDRHACRCDGDRPALVSGSGPLLGMGRQGPPSSCRHGQLPQAPRHHLPRHSQPLPGTSSSPVPRWMGHTPAPLAPACAADALPPKISN